MTMKTAKAASPSRRREPLTDTQLLLTITVCIFFVMYGLALLIWRFFTYYLYLIVGIFTILLEKIILRREARKRQTAA